MLKNALSSRILTVLLSLIAFIFVFQFVWKVFTFFSDVFLILFLAWLLSFIIDPLVDALVSYRFPRVISAACVYFIIASLISGILFLFLPFVIAQIVDLSKQLPKLAEQTPKYIATLESSLRSKGIQVNLTKSFGDYISALSTAGTNTADQLIGVISSFLNTIVAVILVLIISFYLVLDGEKLEHKIIKFLPTQWQDEVAFISITISNSFAGFLRGQLSIALIWGIAVWIILALFGINYAAVAALISGILMIIPVIGGFLGIIPPMFLLLLTNPTLFWIVFFILLGVQLIETNIFAPMIFERTVGLHPVLVLVSFLIGLKLGGGWGALFAVPVGSILWAIFKAVAEHFKHNHKFLE